MVQHTAISLPVSLISSLSPSLLLPLVIRYRFECDLHRRQHTITLYRSSIIWKLCFGDRVGPIARSKSKFECCKLHRRDAIVSGLFQRWARNNNQKK
jgi:hypothetical protein